ncbi:hypothetical protein OnM2_044089, partial [Erysiphe neolycopersici]
MQQYILEFEGTPEDMGLDTKIVEEYDALIMEYKNSDIDVDDSDEHSIDKASPIYLTSFGTVDGYDTLSLLHNEATRHAITKLNPYSKKNTNDNIITNRYSSDVFQGIVIDTGAAKWSTAGFGQYRALKNI